MKRRFDPKKSLGKTAQRGVAWSFLRESVSEILLFPASMVLARLLTPADFGVAAASIFFIQLAGRISELGFNSVLIRAKEVKPIHLSTVFVVQLCIGITWFTVITLAAPLVGAFYRMPEPAKVLPIAAVGFLISPFGSVAATILQRNYEYKKNTTIDWTQLVVTSVVNIVLALLGFRYMSIIYARLASNLTVQTMRLYFSKWRPSLRFSWAALREILPEGTGFFAKRLLDYAAQNGDNLVVGRMQGLTELGLYDKAYSTMNRFLARMNTGGPGAMFRIFSVIHEDPERLRRAYRKVMMSASLLGFPIMTALAVMAPQVMVVMFGSQWRAAASPFSLMCAAGVLKLLNSYASAATQAAGLIWSEVWRQVLYTIMIVVGIVALSGWGPTGAAAAVLGATAVMSVLMHILLRRVTHLPWSEMARPLVPALMCSAGTASVVLLVEYALRSSGPEPNAWLLVACQVPAAALFVLSFVLFVPHRELRAVVLEMANTLAPNSVKRHRWAKAYLEAHAGAAVEPGSA